MSRILHRARGVLVVALVALTAPIVIANSSTSDRASAAPTLDPSTLGMRASGGFPDLARVDQIERQLGQPLRWYTAMADRRSPEKMRASVRGQVKAGSLFAQRPNSINVVMTMPLAFGTGTSKTAAGRESIRQRLRETADGKWDADFRLAAQSLIAAGHGDAVLRLGHEFTGSWYPWSAQQNETVYIAAYRHIHDVMQSESSKFRFEWNAARNTFQEYGPPAYPGDRYVDIISMDVYYEPWKGDPDQLTDDVWQRRYVNVMKSHRDFARQHGKQVAYTEWANGDIDQPRFIEGMHAWFVSLPTSGGGSLAYHSYFNATNETYNLNGYPKSKAAYLRLFGHDGATPRAIAPASGSSPSIDLPAKLSATAGTTYRIPASIDADSIKWWKVSGSAVSWDDKTLETPSVNFSESGTYVLRVKAFRSGADPVAQSVTVDVAQQPTSPPPTPPAPPVTNPPVSPSSDGAAQVSVRDTSVVEGENLVFKFVLTQPALHDVVVTYTFADESVSGDDYHRPNTTEMVIPKGAQRAFLGVRTIEDGRPEGAEIVRLVITSADGATIDDGSAKGTITDS